MVTTSHASDIGSFLDDVAAHRVDVIGLEKTVPKKVHMASASLGKFMMHSPSALWVQTNQAVKSADRGARKAAGMMREKTTGLVETASDIETRLREIGKR